MQLPRQRPRRLHIARPWRRLGIADHEEAPVANRIHIRQLGLLPQKIDLGLRRHRAVVVDHDPGWIARHHVFPVAPRPVAGDIVKQILPAGQIDDGACHAVAAHGGGNFLAAVIQEHARALFHALHALTQIVQVRLDGADARFGLSLHIENARDIAQIVQRVVNRHAFARLDAHAGFRQRVRTDAVALQHGRSHAAFAKAVVPAGKHEVGLHAEQVFQRQALAGKIGNAFEGGLEGRIDLAMGADAGKAGQPVFQSEEQEHLGDAHVVGHGAPGHDRIVHVLAADLKAQIACRATGRKTSRGGSGPRNSNTTA